MAAGTPCKHHSPAAIASRRRCRVCAAVSLALLFLLTVAVAMLVITALRPRATSATLEGLRLVSLSLSPGAGGPSSSPDTPAPSLNATFDADLSIRNPSSLAAFEHDAGGRAEVYYRGAIAAKAGLPAGRVGPGGAEAVTVRLTVLAGRLAARAPQLYADLVGAGDVPLVVRTVVPGKATVFGVLRRRVVVTTVCDVVISVRSMAAETSSCRYRTKL
ncbi:hypothetical protein QOZ80_5BG0425070 [Eleusine coracana subsp. coracana]|nr:hypothetical protein QOZ80_5BG0425070 [Eleusine coracana subsp. coracana]